MSPVAAKLFICDLLAQEVTLALFFVLSGFRIALSFAQRTVREKTGGLIWSCRLGKRVGQV